VTAHKRYLTTSGAAVRLGLSRYTIQRAVACGDLAVAGRTPAGWARFDPATVEAYARRLLANGQGRHTPRPTGVGANAGAPPVRRPERGPQRNEGRFRALVEHATDLVAIVDAGGVIRYASPSYERTLGYAPANLEGTPALDLVHPDERARVLGAISQRAGEPGSTGGMEFRVCHADGSWRTLDVTTANRLHDPAVRGIITTARDVTDRAHAVEALRQSEERYRQVEQHAPIGLALVSPAGRWLRVNPALCALVGYTTKELLARTFQDVTHPDDLDADVEQVRRVLAGAIDTYQMEKRYVRKDGALVWVLLSVSLVRDAAGQPLYFISQIQDIDQRKQAEESLRHQALHDSLTGLPNRAALHDRLGQALRVAAREGAPLALFLLDLNRFKEVNDTLGHDVDDALLQEVSRRIQGTLRASDTVARLGGDEFAVLLPGDDRDSAMVTARKLLAVLVEPVALHGQAIVTGGSVGIAVYPEHGDDAATLLRRADVAMYAAKRGGTGYAVYSLEQDQHSPSRLTLIGALQGAVARDELRLHYQPTVDVGAGQVHTVEALARWQHPERSLLLPDEFIPLAEGTGLIVPLTRWVLETAIRQMRTWRDAGLDLAVAVNLSAHALHDPDLPTLVADLLRAYDVPATRLRVELTESAVMADPAGALDVLTRLSALRLRIAIDDFGTGYSSLSYLKRLPIDEIKIDRSFVTHMTRDGDDATIVASTIGLGHSLGLRFVAEGVEDRATWQALDALGCDGAQGFYISHALPADELERWLRETSWARESHRQDQD